MLNSVGGPSNVTCLTRFATRLCFELVDRAKADLP
ncbi:PTS transporter subunit EIIB [Rathayibacter sp. VKM Ac-2760]|nr:PTS transporter subunit EIIB [Rathayibacter sp. VKM Ac-2760]